MIDNIYFPLLRVVCATFFENGPRRTLSLFEGIGMGTGWKTRDAFISGYISGAEDLNFETVTSVAPFLERWTCKTHHAVADE